MSENLKQVEFAKETLKIFEDRGEHMEDVRHVIHYMYGENFTGLGAALRELGYSVKPTVNNDGIVAERHEAIGEAWRISTLVGLCQLADTYGVEYDGWEASMIRQAASQTPAQADVKAGRLAFEDFRQEKLMPRRTEIPSILIIGAARTPSPRRGEGWGEGARRLRVIAEAGPPHPTLSPLGRGFEEGDESLRADSREQQFLPDRFEHAVGVVEHIVVPVLEHPVAVILDDCCSRGVPHRVVLAAIQLDRQPGRAAGEVGDIIVDLKLPDEFFALKPSAAQMVPKALFGVGLVGAQLARDRSQALSSHRRTPSPNPLPAGERASDCPSCA